MVEELQRSVNTFKQRAEDLERENEILRAQVKVLTAQQQNQQRQQQQQQQQPQQSVAQATSSEAQVNALRDNPDALAATLLSVLQGGNAGGGPGTGSPTLSNSLAQLLPSLQGFAAGTTTAVNPALSQASNNTLDGLGQLLKNLQGGQQQGLQMPPQPSAPRPLDLQGMLNMLTGNVAAMPPPAPPPPNHGLNPGLLALAQSAGISENVIRELLAQQQQSPPQMSVPQQSGENRSALLESLTGQFHNSHNGKSNNPLADLLANMDPRQNVFAGLLQGNFGGGANVNMNHAPSLGSQTAGPGGRANRSNSVASLPNRGAPTVVPSSGSNPSDNGGTGAITNHKTVETSLVNPQSIPGREQINQMLSNLDTGTLYNILKQKPDSQHPPQGGDKPGESDPSSRGGGSGGASV